MIVVGSGDLGQAVARHFSVSPWSSSDLDLRDKERIDLAAQSLRDHNDRRMVITAGIFHSENIWDMMQVNYVGPVYLIEQIRKEWNDGEIVVVGSVSARWQSWPGVNTERIVYNVSKSALSDHVASIAQQGYHPVRVQCLDPGRFQSKMSYNRGMPISDVVQMIDYMLKLPDQIHVSNIDMRYRGPDQ